MEDKLYKLFDECVSELNKIGINLENNKVGNIDIKLSKRSTKRYGCCKQEEPDKNYKIIEKRGYRRIIKYEKFNKHHIEISNWVMQLNDEIIKNTIELEINEKEKIFNIKVSQNIKDEELIKYNIDKMIKNLFKNNTGCILQERLPYWSKITKLPYKSFNVRDAKTKYGSCKPDTKQLYFSSRLIMLPEDKIDAIIVHELCHIVHRNHSQNFYDLVKQYIPNYKEIDKWLKQNAKELNF